MSTFLEAVKAAEQAWNASYLAGDVEAFGALLHEQFVYSSERGVFARPGYLANLASGVIDMRGLETTQSSIRVVGPVAVVTGVARLDASFEGQDISGDDRFTRVWLHDEDGHARALAQHASAMTEPS